MRIFCVGQEVFIFYADIYLLIGFNFAIEFYLKYTLLINCLRIDKASFSFYNHKHVRQRRFHPCMRAPFLL